MVCMGGRGEWATTSMPVAAPHARRLAALTVSLCHCVRAGFQARCWC